MCPIFFNTFFYHQMIVLQKLWKIFFILSKKLFSFSRYSFFLFPASPLFVPVGHCFRAWSKINLKVNDINCLDKNLIIHLVWYLEKKIRYYLETLSTDRVFNKEHFQYVHQKLVTDLFFILVNNPKRPLLAWNSFQIKKEIYEKP